MQQFLYRIRPARPAMLSDGPTAHESQVVGRHFEYLEGLTKAGTVLMAGRTLNSDETAFGIVVFEAASEEDARRIVDADPAVAEGVMKAELFPYRVALWSDRGGG